MSEGSPDERVLILAPYGRDARLAAESLAKAGVDTCVCADLADLCRAISVGAGAVLATEEALMVSGADRLVELLERQPPWSDLPLVILTGGGGTTRATLRVAELLWQRANATFLERPIRAMTLVGAMRSAVRARRRQYEIRDYLDERQRLLEAEQQARAVSEAALRSRDEFLLTAAHELRTPLTTMRGRTQLLLRQLGRGGSLDRERMLLGLRTIEQQTDTLSRLIMQLLDVTRLGSETLVLEPEPVRVAALVERAVAEARLRTQIHEVNVDAPDRSVEAHLDPLRIGQVLSNLLDNAIKYSPDGGPIQVMLRRELGDRVVISVRDHGLGVPTEKRARIFERYYQAHAEGHFGGMGLGLYISRQIVELHGGDLSAEFPDDGGTRFLVRLPTIPAA